MNGTNTDNVQKKREVSQDADMTTGNLMIGLGAILLIGSAFSKIPPRVQHPFKTLQASISGTTSNIMGIAGSVFCLSGIYKNIHQRDAEPAPEEHIDHNAEDNIPSVDKKESRLQSKVQDKQGIFSYLTYLLPSKK
ncbi:MAG: hypothetical protein VXZ72_02800 [Chlamydiota bacterium]|nr:hypothetical protein [Chlamydiota bacterium]